jgi:outer membrane protein assembly factor BamB
MKLIISMLLLLSCSFNKIKLKNAEKIETEFNSIKNDLGSELELNPLFSYNNTINENPIIIDDQLIYTTRRGKLYVYNLIENKDVSSYRMTFGSNISPVANNKYLVNLTGKGFDNVYVYDFVKKQLKWKEKLGSGFESNPILIDNELYAASTAGILYKVDLVTFEIKKQVKFKSSVRVDLVSDESSLFIIDANQNIYALNKDDFSRKWKLSLKNGSFIVKPEINGDFIYTFSDKGVIYKINRFDGSIVWLRQFGKAFYTAATIVDNEIFVGNVDGFVYRVDDKGELIAKYDCGSIVGTKVIVGPEKIYVGSGKGEYLIFKKNTGDLLWKHSFKGRFKANPVIWNNKILLYTDYDDTYILSDKKE